MEFAWKFLPRVVVYSTDKEPLDYHLFLSILNTLYGNLKKKL